MSDNLGLSGQFLNVSTEKVVFGRGSLGRLLEEVDRLGAQRVLILTGNTLATQTPVIQRIQEILGSRFAGTYPGIRERAQLVGVLEAINMGIEQRADGLVTVGGSSVANAASVIACGIAYGLRDVDGLRSKSIELRQLGGVPESDPVPPQITVVTTLSAGEYAASGGAADRETGERFGFFGPSLAKSLVLLDPEVTVHTPDWLWHSTGIKALDRSIERLYSLERQPYTDATACKSIELLFRGLPASKEHPVDMDARLNCLIGAWLSSVARPNTPMALSFALGHALGAMYDIRHGYTSCVTQPAVMEFNRPVAARQVADVARAAGVFQPGMSDDEAAGAAVTAVGDLIAGLGLPRRLRDVGIPESDLPAIAEHTLQDSAVRTNPVPVTGVDQVLELLKAIY
jgi:alcohol dehydrogenase class IV